jgi:hypothetical protein
MLPHFDRLLMNPSTGAEWTFECFRRGDMTRRHMKRCIAAVE